MVGLQYGRNEMANEQLQGRQKVKDMAGLKGFDWVDRVFLTVFYHF